MLKKIVSRISLAATLIQQSLTFCRIFYFCFYECGYVYSLCVFRLLNHLIVNTGIMTLPPLILQHASAKDEDTFLHN